jgi:oligosaccharide repeat unit polymerase
MNPSATGLALAIVLLVVAGWSLAFLAPLHPVQLWAIPWSIAVALYALRLLPYRSLSWTTTSIASAAALGFALFSLAGERAAEWLRRPNPYRPRPFAPSYATARIAALAVVSITVVGIAAFVASASASFGTRDTLTASSRLRTEISNGALSIQIKYVYVALAAVALCGVAAGLASKRLARVTWLSAAAICAASIYLATGRATVISALIVGLVAYLSSRGRPIRVGRLVLGICTVVAVAVGIFIVGGELIGKTYANSADLQSVPSVFTRHSSLSNFALPYQYASAPIAALDVQTRSVKTWGDADGCAEVAELCKGLRRLNVHVQPVPRIRPFTAPPLPWNTYTALDLPLIDGGKALAVPIVALLGLICGVLWAWSRRREPIGVLVYAVAAAAIVGSPAVFLFTAPHIVGAGLIGALALWLASKAQTGVPTTKREAAGALPN